MSDGSLFAVGDVHGCLRELEALLGALPLQPQDTLVFLGDYIDRGPSSSAVVERLCGLRRERPDTVFLRGNHEDMCLAFLGRDGRHGAAFMGNGGDRTAASYGVAADDAAALERAMPAAHLHFIEATRASYEHGRYLCVHAGVRPDVPLAEQETSDLLWIRTEFLQTCHGLDRTVVFGHTPLEHVLIDLPHKIGIDTGCVYGGCLTAAELPAGRLYQVARGQTRVRQSTLAAARLA
jgi:diadenosine tetraphosphatase ApaH/serine/threonine PP2A family protein phosphatase